MTSPTVDSETLAAAFETSSLEFWRAVCRHIPGAAFHHDAGAAWFQTPVPFFPFNQVLSLSVPPDGAGAAIYSLLGRFRAAGLPFCWNVGPASRPDGLAALLEARRPDRTGAMPAMALDLSRPFDTPAPPDGLVIERVRDAAGLDRWARAYGDSFGLPQAFVDALAGVYAAIGFDAAVPFRHYAGLLDGEPIACCTVFFGAARDGAPAVAVLWHIGTVEAQRRRGIGAALTLAALPEARDLGCRAAILYASEMGRPLYRRLGFRELFRLAQYGWGGEAL
jgi:GNAT superfamily N-acetyltransferase